jgi:hypothetical protein
MPPAAGADLDGEPGADVAAGELASQSSIRALPGVYGVGCTGYRERTPLASNDFVPKGVYGKIHTPL